MSFWLLTVAVGNLFVPLITEIQSTVVRAGTSAAVNPATFYLYAGLTLAVTVVFVWIARGYKDRALQMAGHH
jgi:dipeptide/tripeptide permease